MSCHIISYHPATALKYHHEKLFILSTVQHIVCSKMAATILTGKCSVLKETQSLKPGSLVDERFD
jgi:hypothetical protein